MGMQGIIKSRNGHLYVLYTYDELNEPMRQYRWWRILETRSNGYGDRPEAGDIVTYTGSGAWSARHPSTERSTGSIFASTEAESMERVSIPAPASRGKELRWYNGRWEKLMARGWVPAGEGKQ